MILGFHADARVLAFFPERARPVRVDRLFRTRQLLSAALYSLGHGGNDAQKTMGIIVAALARDGPPRHPPPGNATIPLWVVLPCHAAMGLGTYVGRLAHREDHGHEDHQARPAAASAPRPAGPSRSSWRRAWACPCPPRTPSRARSSAWVCSEACSGALGRRRTDRLGVGVHDSRVRRHRRRHLYSGRAQWAYRDSPPDQTFLIHRLRRFRQLHVCAGCSKRSRCKAARARTPSWSRRTEVRRSERRSGTTQQMGLFQQPATPAAHAGASW